MSDVTELRCWPSCIDALDWSQDGIIALASDERVELLVSLTTKYTPRSYQLIFPYQFPNTVSYDRDQHTAQWQHIPLPVPWFTNDELPTKEPAPLATYSIGEEISASAPMAIAWSLPGLAKHRRCALAALTANLILSIWSSDGKQHEGPSWERRLILNDALAAYFSTNPTNDPSHVTSDPLERMRLQSRVRAFAWAPALPNSQTFSTLGSRLSYGPHILAVCNDDNQVAFVLIHSPTSTYRGHPNWNAEVLMHVSLTCKSESTLSAPSILDDMIKQQRHVSHISWSPWISRRGYYYSILVYATNEDVRARIATYKNSRLSLGDEVLYPSIEMRYYGPLKWCPAVDNDVLTLALFTASGLICLTLSIDDASIIKRATHSLDGRWDQISGAVWDVTNRPTTRLHFSSLLSTIRNPTSVLEASPATLTLHGVPSWREQIENSASLFSAKNDLKGNTKTKVWGLATSPLRDFIATCHSVHPSDMIEYGSPNDRRGTVAVSGLRNYREMRQSFPAQDVSAEGMLFTLKKLVENTVEDSEQMPDFIEEIAEKLFLAYGSVQVSGNEIGPSLPPSEIKGANVLEMLTQDLKRAVLFDTRTLRDRYTILASYACNKSNANDLQRTLIAYRLATAVRDISTPLPKSLFSAEICTHHEKLTALIQNIMGDDGFESRFADTSIDTCDFCSAPIPFTDLMTASCTNGHQFPRCGLSFLAIQAPGITKYCGICSTPFLNEEFVDVQEKNSHLTCMEEPDENKDVNLPARGIVAYLEANNKGSNQSYGNGEASTRAQPSSDKEDRLDGVERGQSGGEESRNLATEEEQRDTTITLARVLFLACDVCIYCGGKFVG
jgi:hypothetical protein